jgi:2'-5' RNA ligase
MRCFIAVDVTQEIASELEKVSREAMRFGIEANFVKKELMHVNLAFLGERTEEDVESIGKKLSSIRFAPFKIRIVGLGFFPNASFVRVFWAGVEGRELTELQKVVADSINYREDREYSPHVTLARIKGRQGAKELVSLAQRFKEKEFGEMRVDSFALKQSTLTSSGPAYEDLRRFYLNK